MGLGERQRGQGIEGHGLGKPRSRLCKSSVNRDGNINKATALTACEHEYRSKRNRVRTCAKAWTHVQHIPQKAKPEKEKKRERDRDRASGVVGRSQSQYVSCSEMTRSGS